MDVDIVQQHAPGRCSGAVAHRQRCLRFLGQEQRHMRQHLRVGEQHGVRTGDILAIHEQAAIVAAFDRSDSPRQTLGVVNDVEALRRRAQVAALQFGVEGLAVREHQQVRDGRDDKQRDPLSPGRALTAQQESQGNSKAEVYEEQRGVPHPHERDEHESCQQAADYAAERIREKRVSGFGANPIDVVRINAHAEREQYPHEHGGDERHSTCQGHANRQLVQWCDVGEVDREGFELPEQQEHDGTAESCKNGNGAEPGLEILAAIHLSRHDPRSDRKAQQESREDERKRLGGRQAVGRQDSHPQHLVTQADEAGKKQENQHVGVGPLLACRGTRGSRASLAQRNDQGYQQVAADGDHQRADDAEVPHEHEAGEERTCAGPERVDVVDLAKAGAQVRRIAEEILGDQRHGAADE